MYEQPGEALGDPVDVVLKVGLAYADVMHLAENLTQARELLPELGSLK